MAHEPDISSEAEVYQVPDRGTCALDSYRADGETRTHTDKPPVSKTGAAAITPRQLIGLRLFYGRVVTHASPQEAWGASVGRAIIDLALIVADEPANRWRGMVAPYGVTQKRLHIGLCLFCRSFVAGCAKHQQNEE